MGGNVWGEDSCCGISAERMREYLRDGEYNLSFVFGGTPGDSAPLAVINGGFDDGVAMTVKELGDGRREATIPLQSVLDGYGVTADDVDGLCVQTWVENFALYKIRLYKPETEPEPDEPCTHPEESREWKSDAESHWQVCKKCGEEVPETKKPHDMLTYEELDSEKHTVKCSACGYSGEEEHSWDGGKTVEATETEKGYILYTCEKCKAEKKVETAHVHNGGGEWVTDETSHWHECTLAGCDYDGGIYGKASHTYVNGVCTVCGYKHKNHTPKAGSYKNVSAAEHSYECSVCGATVAEAHTAGKQDHDADSHWTVCTECGAHIGEAEHSFEYVSDGASGHHRKCSVCDYETETVSHALTYEKLDSDKHTVKCSTCEYTATEEHSWDAGEVHPATETEPGYTLYTCEKCDATKQEALAHEHNGGEEWKKDETSHWHECTLAGCTAEGGIYGKADHQYKDGKCEICQYEHENHNPKAGTYQKVSATEHSYECAVCHKIITESHVETLVIKGDASGHYDYCEECGYTGETQPHDEGSYTANNDGKTHTVNCETCGYKNESEEHVESKNKYDEDDVGRYHVCEYCDARLDVTEHHYVFVDDKNGTTHHEECETCHHIKTDSTAEHEYENGACKDCNYAHPEDAHEWGSWTPDFGGTTHTRTCSICGKEDTDPHNLPEKWTPSSEDETKHLKKCPDCGYEVTGEHNFGDSYEYVDAETHMQTCADCKKTVTSSHNYEEGKYSNSTTDHWQICKDCKGESDRENHKYVDGSDRCSVCNYWNHQHTMKWMDDGENHWEECTDPDCDYKTEKEPHVFDGSYDYNTTQHSQTCSVCLAKVSKDHILVDKYDDDFHWQECEVCDYETRPVRHTLKTDSDENGHWEYCENCKYKSDPVAHTPEKELGHDADSHWSICSECGKVYNKTAHTPSDELKHDSEGHWTVCSVCGYESTEKKEHTWDDGEITVEPTETTEGEKLFTCTECGEIKTEAVPKSSHTHVAGKEWKFDEKTHWHECVSETCDDKTAKLDEAEHVWDDGKVTVEPTYTKEGEKLYTCEVCGETMTETVPVKGHEHSTVTKFDEKGHWEECTICGETVGEVEAHTPGEWITDSEATSTEAGKRHKECTVCGYVTDVLEVPATGDIDVEVPTVGNVPKVELPAEQQEVLKNAIIDEEDVEAIESGASIDIELTVENAESTIAPEDKAKSDEAAAQGSYTHVRYLDINLTKVVTDASGASTSEEVSELGKEVRIVITVPLALAKPTGRDFAVIRVHDGEATVLKDLDSDPNTVTISTNLFSSYTLVYVDTTPVPSTPGGMIGHAHVITGLQNDAHYHWRGCFICSMRVDYEPHRFINGVCTVCGYHDPNYVPEVEEEEPAEEAPDTEVTVVDAPAEGTEQGGDSEGTPEVTDTPADLPETEAEVVEVKEDDETSENPKTGVVFTGIGAVMAALAALVAKRK